MIKSIAIWTCVILALPLLFLLSFVVRRFGLADEDGKPLPSRSWPPADGEPVTWYHSDPH